MDTILSEFITRTSADPGLARDLLEGKYDSVLLILTNFIAARILKTYL